MPTANARRTAFREIPSFREIALIAIPSGLRSRRISAQSFPVITVRRATDGVHCQASIRGQFSPAVDTGHPCALA